jgi:hypothetical protein
MLLDRSDNKVTSFQLIKYGFAAALLDIGMVFLLIGMQT